MSLAETCEGSNKSEGEGGGEGELRSKFVISISEDVAELRFAKTSLIDMGRVDLVQGEGGFDGVKFL